jgi:hypothetical protein
MSENLEMLFEEQMFGAVLDMQVLVCLTILQQPCRFTTDARPTIHIAE